MPPMAHRLPATIVSQRSRSSASCAPFCETGAATNRSTTSTPRVEPMRHGVHLPHDSSAQNSIA